MFRIERRMVNLGAIRTIRIDGSETEEAAIYITQENPNVPDRRDVQNTEVSRQANLTAREIIDDATAEAERIINDAKDEAAGILYDAREEVEADRRAAWEEGYTEGADEGRHSYDEQLSSDIAENEESLKRVIKELYDERELTFSGLEKDMAELSLQIVRKVINPSDEALQDVFESLIKNALKQNTPEDKIVLRVSPTDYEKYFSAGHTVFELEGGVTVSASVLRDISLNEFDCIIDKEDSTINAGLDTQLKQIQLAFTRGL